MTVPLVVLAGARRSSAACSTCRSPALECLDHWLEPVVRSACPSSRRRRSSAASALDVLALVDRRSSASCSACAIYRHGLDADGATRSTSGSAARAGARQRVLLRRRHLARFVGGPGHRVRRLPRPTSFDQRGHRRRGQRRRHGSCASRRRGLRRLQTGLVRNYALGDRRSARSLLLAVPRRSGWPSDAPARPSRRLPASSPRSSLVPRGRRAGRRCSCPAAPARARARGRVRRRPRRPSALALCLLCAVRHRHAPATSSSRATAGSASSASAGRSASTASACSWSCSPRCCSRSALLASAKLDHGRRRSSPGCCCSRPACIGVFLALDLSCSSCSSSSCSSRCTSSSRAGATTTARYAAMKFFLFTMAGSAFLLVGILVARVPAPARRPARAHLRPARRSPTWAPATSTAAPPSWLFLGVRRRVRGQGAAVPVPHLAARRAHRGADRGLGRPGRRHAEDRHLRLPALRAPAVPAGRRSTSRRCCSSLGVIGIIYGAIVAAMQTDLKRLVAYSSVAHLGLRRARHLRAHDPGHLGRRASRWSTTALTTGALFLLVGMLYDRRHTCEIAELRRAVEGGADPRRRCSSRRRSRRSACPASPGFVGEFLVAARHVPHRPLVRGRRRHRRDPRRGLPAVGVPAGVHGRARRARTRAAATSTLRELVRGRAAARPQPVPRLLPEAGARPHRSRR